MRLPRSLGDLPDWRQSLLDARRGTLSRQFGERLRDLHVSRATGRIDQAMFEDSANQIAEDLAEHEHELPYWDHHLANADLGLQYMKFSEEAGRTAGLDRAAIGGPARAAIGGPARAAIGGLEGAAVRAGENVQVVAQRHGIVDPVQISVLEAMAAEDESS
jgi:hypothetical protein